MEEKLNYMFQSGFLGTRAPFFMDMVTLIVAFLPMIMYFSILFAKYRHYKFHALTQNIIFVFAIIVIGYFELGVRVGGGFDGFMQESNVSNTYAFVVLLVHIVISIVTLFYWFMTIMRANITFYKGLLPGKDSRRHKVLAAKTYFGVIFTSFSGIWVYLLLFIF